MSSYSTSLLLWCDFSTNKELIAYDKTLEQIQQWLNASKLYYLSNEDLRESIGLSICDACITGSYPTPYGEELHKLTNNGNLDDSVRHYEQIGSSQVITNSNK